jgi:predicted lipoprotein with Yx(FWY)xxD motif
MLSVPRPLRTVMLVALAGMSLVACQPSAGGASSASTSGAVTVGSANTSLGTFLTGPNGKTLYTHAGDSMNTSTCTGQCLTAWPALTVAAGHQPTAGSGVTGQLATFSRSDGSQQVTYNGLPLYYWQGDTKAGDTTGQGIAGFSVALVAGAAAGTPAASASSSARGY